MQQSRTTVKSLLHHLKDFKWNELCFRSINRTWNPPKVAFNAVKSWCKILVHCIFSLLTHLQFSWLENTFDKMWSNLSYLPICSIFNHIYHPFSLQKFIIQMSLTWKIKYKANVIEGATCLSCLLKRRVKAPPISQRKTFLLYKSLAFLRCLVGTKKFDLLFLWPSKSYKKWKDATYCLKLTSKVSPT